MFVGDFIEVDVLGFFFLNYFLYEIYIGFVKVNIGYFELGVGVVVLIKVFLMIKNGLYVFFLYVEFFNLKIFFSKYMFKVCQEV